MTKLAVLVFVCLVLVSLVQTEAANVQAKGQFIDSIKSYIAKKAKQLTDKIGAIATKLGVTFPAPGTQLTQDQAQNAAKDLATKTQAAADSEYHSNTAAGANGEVIDHATTFNSIITTAPDAPSDDHDGDTTQAATEAAGTSDAFYGLAARLTNRAEAASSTDNDMTPPADADVPQATDSDQTLSLLESEDRVNLSRNRMFRRRRRGSVVDFVKTVGKTFLATMKKLKTLVPQTISAGIGGNAGPLAFSVDLGIDYNLESMGVIACVGGLFGTDSIGISGNYHMQVGWYGTNQYKSGTDFSGVWAGFSAGVTASVGFAAANIPLSVGAAIAWGANGIADKWKEFQKQLTAIHTASPAVVASSPTPNANANSSGGAKFSINFSDAKNAALKGWKDLVAAKDLLLDSIKATLPNGDDTIVANVAIGTGLSPATLAAGADIFVSYCATPWVSTGKTKLWKLLLASFVTSGPAGAVLGLVSWMTYHADVVKQTIDAAEAKIKAGLAAVSAAATSLKTAAFNFFSGKLVAASAKMIAAAKAAGQTVKAGAKFFFATGKTLSGLLTDFGNKLKDAKNAAVTKLKGFFGKA
jgi:hypothetical protein